MSIHISHEYINIIINFELVLEIATHVCTHKSVARSDQHTVFLVVVGGAIDAHFYNRKSYFSDIEWLQESLVLYIWCCIIFVDFENEEVFLFILTFAHHFFFILNRFAFNHCLGFVKLANIIHRLSHITVESLFIWLIRLVLFRFDHHAKLGKFIKYLTDFLFCLFTTWVVLCEPKLNFWVLFFKIDMRLLNLIEHDGRLWRF